MTNDNTKQSGIDRRSLLKRAGTISTIPLFATTTGATDDDGESSDSGTDERVINNISLTIDRFSDVEEASVTFLEKGDREVVRTRIHSAHDVEPGGARRDIDPTMVTHSFSLDQSLQNRVNAGEIDLNETAEISRLNTDDITLERSECTTTVKEHFSVDSLERRNQIGTIDIPEEPDFPHLGEAVTWVETASSECGPLCRTNLIIEFTASDPNFIIDDSIGIYETVNGSTCDGEEFGDRFPCWDLPPWVDCSVPDAFDTTWHTDNWDYDLTSAEADYYNNDFPIIPRSTAKHEQDAWFEGPTLHIEGIVEHSGTIGFRSIIRFLLKRNSGVIFY